MRHGVPHHNRFTCVRMAVVFTTYFPRSLTKCSNTCSNGGSARDRLGIQSDRISMVSLCLRTQPESCGNAIAKTMGSSLHLVPKEKLGGWHHAEIPACSKHTLSPTGITFLKCMTFLSILLVESYLARLICAIRASRHTKDSHHYSIRTIKIECHLD